MYGDDRKIEETLRKRKMKTPGFFGQAFVVSL